MQYMEAAREDEGPVLSHSDEDLSNDEEAIASGGDAVVERAEPKHQTSAEDYGLGATDRRSNLDHGGQEETAITRLSFGNKLLKESGRSSSGSGVPSVARNVSVETPEKGERALFVPVETGL